MLEIAFVEYRMHYVRYSKPQQVNTSSKSVTFPQFLAIRILKWRIQPVLPPSFLPFFLCFFYQSPQTILENKIPRVAREKEEISAD